MRRLLTSNLSRLVGAILLVVLLALRIADPIFVSNLRNQAFDTYQRISPRPYTRQPVAIVDIDERSLAQVGQWPWPRTRIAELIARLSAQGTVVTGFDIVFSEPDRLSPPRIAADNPSIPDTIRESLSAMPSNEAAMAKAMQSSRVVLGETISRAREANCDPQADGETPHAAVGPDPKGSLVAFTRLVRNLETLTAAAAGRGLFTANPDPDGVFRRVPLVFNACDSLRLTLTLEMLRIATGGKPFLLRSDAAGISSVNVGGVAIPTDQLGRLWPWFSQTQPARYVSATDVLSGSLPAGRLAGHLVIVGTSSVGLEDYRATPIDAAMPGVEIHAQILETILTGQYLVRPNYAIGMELVFVGIAGLLAIIILPWIGAVRAALAAIIAASAFGAGSYFAFTEYRLLIDPTYPIGATLTLFVAMATGNYIREEFERRRIRSAFGQYLAPAMVEKLESDPESLNLGGELRELTILFTDVRGFTALSESYKSDPEALTHLMNEFLSVMSEAIIEHVGTVDKYMGDAIMAFWNAPLETPDHELHACHAAIAMQANVKELNRRRLENWQDGDLPFHEIVVGVGVNSGDCVVGNMGSAMRFDYTAIGDTVNLASRLEGQSKPFGVPIVLGQATALAVQDEVAVLEIDKIRVKGKGEPEHIYALLGDEKMRRSDDFNALVKVNDTMLDLYRRRQWKRALSKIDEFPPLCMRLNINLDGYLGNYAARIRDFHANPPPRGWDAVHVATEK